MSLVAIVPVANLLAANQALEAQGFGPENFSVPVYANAGASFAALHAAGDNVFIAAVKALANVIWEESTGDPIARTQALIAAQGGQWGARAADLPSSGNAIASTLYRYGDSLWWCIQTFNRTTFSAHPSTYPSLIRIVRQPGQVEAWTQPIDQYDSYQLVNPFTGDPDECTHNGQRWKSTTANNVWEPGVFGWVQV